MKTNFLKPAATIAMAFALYGCAKNEVSMTYQPSDDIESVGISVATAKTNVRGASASVSTLQASELDVYIVSTLESTDATGTEKLTYTYGTSAWAQKETALTWNDIDYPSNFFCLFDSAADGEDGSSLVLSVTEATNGEDTAVGGDDDTAAIVAKNSYTVSGDATAHKDLVYAGIQIASTPNGANASMVFYHALSKIDVYAVTGSDETTPANNNTVYVQSVNLKRVNSAADFDINESLNSSATSTTFWTNAEDGADGTLYASASYKYVENVTDSYSTATNAINGTKVALSDSDATETTVLGSMMIIPQTTIPLATSEDGEDANTTAVTADLASATSTTSYVEVVYFGTQVDASGNTIAFAGCFAQDVDVDGDGISDWDAEIADSETPYYFTSSTNAELTQTSGDTTIAYPKSGEPLYLKVAFPLGYEFSMGKYYHLNLGFGGEDATGGLLADTHYYDEDGNRLPWEVDPQIYEIGDPILPDATSLIGIAVYMVDWVTTTDSTLD